ncbi:MAG: DmsE family decaheme c-type cytochrome, partial [Elusimicrobiota bacterium]
MLPLMMTVVMQAAFLLAGPRHAWAEGGNADYIGADTCLGCHSDKEHFKKNLHAKSLPNAKGIAFEKTCETCHGPGSLHAGAGGDKNNPDFATIVNPSRLKPVEAAEICLRCHEGGKRMHWKGSTHDMKNVSCVSCHSMHDDKANGGKAPLLKKASVAEACFQCHAEKKSQIRKSAHMPIVEGKMGCTACHNPHGSAADKLLAKNTVPETCYQCHQDKRGPFLHDHPPARENCATCHDPHGSHHDKMLVTRAPLLCQRCHVDGRHPTSYYTEGNTQVENSRVFY